jgi:hypothetical protein
VNSLALGVSCCAMGRDMISTRTQQTAAGHRCRVTLRSKTASAASFVDNWVWRDSPHEGHQPPNNWMKLTKPAMVTCGRGLCSLSRCSADQSGYEAVVVGIQDCRTAGGNSDWQRLQ